MSSEAQAFWNWLNQASQSRIIVRILFRVDSLSNIPMIFGSAIHLFYREESGLICHMCQQFPEEYAENLIPPGFDFGILTERACAALAAQWNHERFENWFDPRQIVAIKCTATATGPCEIGFLVREELAKLYGYLVAAAGTSTWTYLPLAIERLKGLRVDLRRQSLHLQRSLREYTDQM